MFPRFATRTFFAATATALFLMSSVHAQNPNIPAGFESFDAYEEAMFVRIDELAVQQGVDMSKFHEVRDRLRAEHAEARERNDMAAMAEAEALRAHVITRGLERLAK